MSQVPLRRILTQTIMEFNYYIETLLSIIYLLRTLWRLRLGFNPVENVVRQ